MTYSYPIFDVSIVREVDRSNLRWPERGEAADETGLGCNREYTDLRRLSWVEARRVYELESSLIYRLESATDIDDEYHAIEDELLEDYPGLYGLDIGIASTVVALSAARCVPFSSCNAGALGGRRHARHIQLSPSSRNVSWLIY